jgi:sulfur-carrier protein
MRVTVKLFATLVRFRSGIKSAVPFEMELPEGAMVQDLVELLKIPAEETRVIFINNLIEDMGTKLKDGDVVGIFPPVGGG